MRKHILFAVMMVAAVIIGWAIATTMAIYRDPNLGIWPAITRCRLCDERIWAWQDYERREFKVETDNPCHIAMSVGMSGLVHCRCQGTPSVKIGINTRTKNDIPSLQASP